MSEAVTKQDGSELPPVIERCIEYIEAKALKSEGIFRLSGSALNINEYKAKFDRGEEPPLGTSFHQLIMHLRGIIRLIARTFSPKSVSIFKGCSSDTPLNKL